MSWDMHHSVRNIRKEDGKMSFSQSLGDNEIDHKNKF